MLLIWENGIQIILPTLKLAKVALRKISPLGIGRCFPNNQVEKKCFSVSEAGLRYEWWTQTLAAKRRRLMIKSRATWFRPTGTITSACCFEGSTNLACIGRTYFWIPNTENRVGENKEEPLEERYTIREYTAKWNAVENAEQNACFPLTGLALY